jgi:hypothetical protein
MTTFVLQDNGSHQIVNYAKFLSQPLELGMFVPCVDNEIFNYSKHGNKEQFEQAKERVSFNGFEYCESQKKGIELNINLFVSPYTEDGRIYLTKKKTSGFHSWFQLFTIEDLVQCDLQLTQTAIKQLGL